MAQITGYRVGGGAMNHQIWYEDFIPGLVFKSVERVIKLSDIDTYAELTGERHPVHLDETFARSIGFRGRIAHGLFSLALVEGLKSGLGLFEKSVVASLGWNSVKFSSPLEPGDRVQLRLEFIDRRPSSKAGRGLATERGFLLKSDGTEVVRGDHLVIILKRPNEADDLVFVNGESRK